MPARVDYRKLMTHAVLWVFFGVLAAFLAPDLGHGLKTWVIAGGVLATAYGIFLFSTLPVTGVYRPLTSTASVLALTYAVLAVLARLRGESEFVQCACSVAKGLGASSLFLTAVSIEILCRKLHWQRLARGWFFTGILLGLIYAIPSVMGWFWPFYGSYVESFPRFAALLQRLSTFDFHGMRLADLSSGPGWLRVIWLGLAVPVVVMLINLLRTYVQVASPPPRADTGADVQWSRR